MAKKVEAEIIFCDQCGGSMPAGIQPFTIEQPDGTIRRLCQECKWAATAEEDQPSLAIDAEIEIDESARHSVQQEVEAQVIEEEAPVAQEAPAGPVTGGVTFTRCKTFICKAAPQAVNFLDQHVAEFVREHKDRLKHATMCQGPGAVGSQGSKEDALFVMIWW